MSSSTACKDKDSGSESSGDAAPTSTLGLSPNETLEFGEEACSEKVLHELAVSDKFVLVNQGRRGQRL